jgi:hypothetical protein
MFSDLIEGASARGHRRPCAYLLTLGLAFVCVNGYAQQALSLDRALQLAQGRSRQLIARDAAATASREMAHAAGQLPDPTLKLGINNLPVTSSDRFSLSRDFMTMRSVGVMQEFTRNDKREARAARYEREAQVADAGRTLTVANLQRETAMAWLERYYSERMREVLVQQRDEAKLQIEAADTVYRTGKGSQADVFAARSAVAQIEDRIAQADRQVLAANTRLTRWIGEAAAQSLDRLPAMDKPGVELTQLDTVVAHHPQIAVLKRQEDVAQADVVIAQTNKRADWSAELMFSQRGSAYSNMISINLSVPLQWDQRNRQDRELAATLRHGIKGRRHRPGHRPQGALLPRPHGAGQQVRQARQVALHGHDAGAGLRRRGRRRQQGHGQPAHPAEPGRAHAEVSKACCRQRFQPSAASPGTNATRPSCRRAPPASSSGCMCAPRWTGWQGPALADLYVPDWIAAQEEFLSVRRMQGTDLAGLVDGARQRMRQVGMSEAQIAAVERSGKTQPRITPSRRSAVVVTELMAREGMTVMPVPRCSASTAPAPSGPGRSAGEPGCVAAPRRQGGGHQPGRTGHHLRPAGCRPCPRSTPTTRTIKARWSSPTRAGRWCPACSCRCSSWTCAVPRNRC